MLCDCNTRLVLVLVFLLTDRALRRPIVASSPLAQSAKPVEQRTEGHLPPSDFHSSKIITRFWLAGYCLQAVIHPDDTLFYSPSLSSTQQDCAKAMILSRSLNKPLLRRQLASAASSQSKSVDVAIIGSGIWSVLSKRRERREQRRGQKSTHTLCRQQFNY